MHILSLLGYVYENNFYQKYRQHIYFYCSDRKYKYIFFQILNSISFFYILFSALITEAHAYPEKSIARLTFSPYVLETEHHGSIAAEVAFLKVPRRHATPDGPDFHLRVVRLPATGGSGRTPPVVYLAGGPGGSGVAAARGRRWPVFERLRRETDVLLLDQRGSGLSDPPPECPYVHRFDDNHPLQHDAAIDALRTTARRCIAYWQEHGIDLAAYTTLESVHDIEHLRRALAAPHINLWGMSYGTHLALASIRLYGKNIGRAALMGAEGPDQTLKLPLAADVLLERISAIAVNAGFSDVEQSASRVLKTLRESPRLGRSYMHRGRQVRIGEFDAKLAIATSLGRRSSQQILPLALRLAEKGDYSLLAAIVLSVRDQLGSFNAMQLAMDVASGQSLHRRALVTAQAEQSLFADALNFPHPMLGDGLDLTRLDDDFRAPVTSDIPTLFINGTLDGRTPVENAQALLADFQNAEQLLVIGASHDDELWTGDPEIAERIADFFSGRTPDISPIQLSPPAFTTRKIDLFLMLFNKNLLLGSAALFLMTLLTVTAIGFWWRRSSKRVHSQP